MLIKKATKDDFKSFLNLYEECFRNITSLDYQYFETIVNKRFLYFAEMDHKMVGMVYCFLWNSDGKTVCEIHNLAVSKKYRNRNIATNLVKHAISELNRCCDYFQMIDGSGGITEIIAKKLKFNQSPTSKQTFRFIPSNEKIIN